MLACSENRCEIENSAASFGWDALDPVVRDMASDKPPWPAAREPEPLAIRCKAFDDKEPVELIRRGLSGMVSFSWGLGATIFSATVAQAKRGPADLRRATQIEHMVEHSAVYMWMDGRIIREPFKTELLHLNAIDLPRPRVIHGATDVFAYDESPTRWLKDFRGRTRQLKRAIDGAIPATDGLLALSSSASTVIWLRSDGSSVERPWPADATSLSKDDSSMVALDDGSWIVARNTAPLHLVRLAADGSVTMRRVWRDDDGVALVTGDGSRAYLVSRERIDESAHELVARPLDAQLQSGASFSIPGTRGLPPSCGPDATGIKIDVPAALDITLDRSNTSAGKGVAQLVIAPTTACTRGVRTNNVIIQGRGDGTGAHFRFYTKQTRRVPFVPRQKIRVRALACALL